VKGFLLKCETLRETFKGLVNWHKRSPKQADYIYPRLACLAAARLAAARLAAHLAARLAARLALRI